MISGFPGLIAFFKQGLCEVHKRLFANIAVHGVHCATALKPALTASQQLQKNLFQ